MTKTGKTGQLLIEALEHPQLQEPGGCAYYDDEGKSCIAGTVLRLVGASDEMLQNAVQNSQIVSKNNRALCEFVREKELSLDLLSRAQDIWDISYRVKGESIAEFNLRKHDEIKYLAENN